MEKRKMKKEFRSFADARKFVHTLGLKNQREWGIFCKSGNKPENIPTSPSRTYKKEWESLGDWLGTGYVAHRNRKFRVFEESQKFVHLLKLKNVKEWNQYCKSGNKPDNIPNNPQRTYKQEWISWGNWLGTMTIATNLRKYDTFQKARNYVHDLELKNQKSWITFAKSKKIPDNIPKNPNLVYKNKGWKGMGDWLGNGRTRNYHSFAEAKKIVNTLGLTGANEWRAFVKSGKLSKNIPANPNQVYKDKGWTSWGDWTGTNVVATYKIKYRNFNEAKEFARSLGLKTANEWRKFVKSGKLPKDIPVNPWTTYSKKRKK
jgi:hypothetical protein